MALTTPTPDLPDPRVAELEGLLQSEEIYSQDDEEPVLPVSVIQQRIDAIKKGEA